MPGSKAPGQPLSLNVLGRLELRAGDRIAVGHNWKHSRALQLLKALAIAPGHRLARDVLYEILAPGKTAKQADNTLHKAVHFLREAAEASDAAYAPVLLPDRATAALDPRIQVDLDAFHEAAVLAAHQRDPLPYERALAICQGDLLPYSPDEPFAAAARASVRALRIDLLVEVARLFHDGGNSDLATMRYQQALAVDASLDQAHLGLMRLYAEAGHRDRALAQYATCRDALKACGRQPSEAIGRLRAALEADRAHIPRAPTRGDARPLSVPSGNAAAYVFVGRDLEMLELRAAVDEASAGNGRIRLLAGGAGIGKTRMAEELGAFIEDRDGCVLWGRCSRDDGAPAYWPWIQMLREYVTTHPALEVADDLGEAARIIAELVPEAAVARAKDAPPIDAEQLRFRLCDAVTTFLRRASQRGLLALIIDDLHDADDASLYLLRFLARSLRSSRLVLIGTYRPAELSPAGAQAIAAMLEERLSDRYELDGLNEHDVRSFVRAAAGLEPSDAVVTAMHRHTDGNPMFMRELLRMLVSNGSHDQLQQRHVESLPLPPGARDVIERRLAALTPACREALEAATVIGREFSLDLLRGTCAAPDPLETLEEAIVARIIAPAEQRYGTFVFRESLARETIYAGISLRKRIALHNAAAEALAARAAASPGRYHSDLAYHYFEAARAGDDVDRAVRAAITAAHLAEDAQDYAAGATEYRRALRAMDLGASEREHRRCWIQLRLGHALKHAGEIEEAREEYRRSAEEALVADDAECLGWAALGYEGFGVTTGAVDENLVALLRSALDAQPTGDGYLRARLLSRLAMTAFWSADPSLGPAYSNEALQMARRLGDPGLMGHALRARHLTIDTEQLEERLGISTELVRMAAQSGDGELEFQGHQALLIDFLEMGDLAGVDGELAALARLAGQLRGPAHQWAHTVRVAMRALLAGRFDEGERLAREAVAVGLRAHDPAVMPYFTIQMLTICTATNRLDEIADTVRVNAEQYPRVVGWRAVLSLVYVRTGELDAARRELEFVASGRFASLPRDRARIAALAICSQVAVAIKDMDRAAVLYELLAPYAGRTIVAAAAVACWGPVSVPLAMLADLLGRAEDARRHFEAALEMAQRMGAAAPLIHVQLEFGRFLRRTGIVSDRERGEDLMKRGMAGFEDLGLSRSPGLRSTARQFALDSQEASPQPEP